MKSKYLESDTIFLVGVAEYIKNLFLKFPKHLQILELRVKNRFFVPLHTYKPVT